MSLEVRMQVEETVKSQISLLFLDLEFWNVSTGNRKPWPGILKSPSNFLPDPPQGQTGIFSNFSVYIPISCPKSNKTLVIIYPDERIYWFHTVVPSPLPFCGNSKMLSLISFKLGTHMYLGEEKP